MITVNRGMPSTSECKKSFIERQNVAHYIHISLCISPKTGLDKSPKHDF